MVPLLKQIIAVTIHLSIFGIYKTNEYKTNEYKTNLTQVWYMFIGHIMTEVHLSDSTTRPSKATALWIYGRSRVGRGSRVCVVRLSCVTVATVTVSVVVVVANDVRERVTVMVVGVKTVDVRVLVVKGVVVTVEVTVVVVGSAVSVSVTVVVSSRLKARVTMLGSEVTVTVIVAVVGSMVNDGSA